MATALRLDFQCPNTKDDLQSSAEGLYCPQCEKSVLDFSHHTKAQIVHELSRYDEMPCVLIPEQVLQKTTYGASASWWRPVRKSAAFIALFLLLGDVKALFAQTKAKPDNSGSSRGETPLGYQKITFKGLIQDKNGQGIANADIRFSFLSNTLGEAKTDADGFFEVTLESYGGIKEVDVSIDADGYNRKTMENVSVLKPDPILSVELEERNTYNAEVFYTLGGIGSYYTTRVTYMTGNTESPLDVFGHTIPRFNTEVAPDLNEKLIYEARVTDMKGNPIPGALVEIRFPKNEIRQGIATQNGLATLYMQLDQPAQYANITVSAPGYYSRTVRFYEFDATKAIYHRLLKKPVSQPAEEEEPVPAITEEPAIMETGRPETPATETETATADHILLFPNPAGETATVQLSGQKNAVIQLTDLTGRILQRKSIYSQSTVVLDVQTLAPGNYVVIIQYEGKTFSEKLVIAR